MAPGSRRRKPQARRARDASAVAGELHAILYGIGDGVIATDPDGRITRMNPAAEALTGWPEGEARGRPVGEVFRIVNEHTREVVANPIVRVLREGKVVGLANHTVLIARDGTERAIADCGAPVHDARGKLVGAVLVFRDQTEERRSQRIVAQARAFAEGIVETARDPLLVLDADLRVVFANRAFYRAFAAGPEETLGRLVYELGEGQWDIPELRALLESVLPQNTHFDDFVVDHVFPGIGRRVMVLNARRLREAGEPTERILLAIEDQSHARAVQEELARTAELLGMAERVGALGILEMDPENGLGAWSAGLYALVGRDPALPAPSLAELLELVHPEDRARFVEEQAAVLEQGGPRRVAFRVDRGDGDERWLQGDLGMVRGADGRSRLVGVVRDVTDERGAEAALRASEERYRHLCEVVSDYAYAFRVEPDGTLRGEWVTASFERMIGFTLPEIQARGGWQTLVHPDDLGRARRHAARVAGGERDVAEFRFVGRTGEVRWLRDHAVPVWDEGRTRVVRIYGASQDITEQKRAEAGREEALGMLERVLAAGRTILYSLRVAPEGLVTQWVSANIGGLLGYSVAEASEPGWWAAHVHPGDREAALRRSARILSGERFEHEYRFVTKDGRTVWILDRVEPLADGTGRVVEVAGTWTDITERHSLEDQIRQAQKMEAIGRLAGGVAHDFNNILSVILSYAGFAMSGVREGDPLRQDLQEIHDAAERAAGLTRQLLAFGRRQMLQPEPLHLNDVVGSMAAMLQRVLGEDIELVQDLSPDLWAVYVDRTQIEQVILNLAVNARDAMAEGGVLTLETANVELDEAYAATHAGVAPGSYVLLSVSDTGVGMSEAVKARVFEPFFTTKEAGRGTGLGLATVYGIVKQSGGHIWVYSELGKGTTFKIYLPRHLEGAGRTETRRAPRAEELRGTETILLVEDEPAVRSAVQRSLEGAGYTVLVAETPGDAMLLAERHEGEIHLVLTDVVMPRLSGKELVGRLAGIRPGLRVLYMSGYTANAVVHGGVVDPGVHFISKPFTIEDLLRAVRRALESPASGA